LGAKIMATGIEKDSPLFSRSTSQSISPRFACRVPSVNDDLSENAAPTYLQKKTVQVGWALMLGSMGFWALVLVVPFLPYSNSERATAVGALLVFAEITFWVGALMAGPDAARRMKTWWRGSQDASRPSNVEPVNHAVHTDHDVHGRHDVHRRHDVHTGHDVQVRTKPS
jgi:hypothetical protein